MEGNTGKDIRKERGRDTVTDTEGGWRERGHLYTHHDLICHHKKYCRAQIEKQSEGGFRSGNLGP
jgi:hypothetical protein